MVRYANLEDAKSAVHAWGGLKSSVQHLGDRGNSVYSFINNNHEIQILRFTDPDFRSSNEVKGELEFVNHLHQNQALVAQPIPTLEGLLTFTTKCASGELICSSIAYAHGIEVTEGSPHWNKTFFNEWGRNLATIHRAASTFVPSKNKAQRWQWENEILISQAEQLIPVDDIKSREEFLEVMALCGSITKSSDNYGLIHADHAAENFRYDPSSHLITAFDFGNCCYHWYAADLANSLSTVRRKKNREEIRENLLNGYTSIKELPANITELIDLFIRLRVVYVYLSRLHFWSHKITRQQSEELALIKGRVHSKTGWGN